MVWAEGIIIDNTISTTNQSNQSQQRHSGGSALSRSSGADQTSSIGTSSNSISSGVGSRNVAGDGALMVSSDHQQSSPTPPLQRRLAKSFSVAPSQSHSKGSYSQFPLNLCVDAIMIWIAQCSLPNSRNSFLAWNRVLTKLIFNSQLHNI